MGALYSDVLISGIVDYLNKPDIQFSFKNSTSQIKRVSFSSVESSISFIGRDSILTLSSCVLDLFVNRNSVSPFFNHGQLILDTTSIHRNILLNSLIQCYESENLEVFNSLIWSNVEIRASSFRNIHFDAEGGSLISSGCTELETISGCLFTNVTTSERRSKLQHLSVSSELVNSFIYDSEEGIYGEIITGLSGGTLSSFICRNTSFHRCWTLSPFNLSSTLSTIRRLHQGDSASYIYACYVYNWRP